MIEKHTKLLVLILTIFGNVAVAAEPAMVSADAPKLPFVTPLKWKSTDILIKPISDDTHKIVSIKDPTVVYWNGLWHIYATAYSTSARTWSMVYLNFRDWFEAPKAKLTYIDVNPDLKRVSLCAASVLFYPAQKVVLYLPVAAAAVLHH